MDAAIQDKVNTWLKGNFDQATKDEITRLQKDNPKELEESFTATWSLEQVVFVALWVWAPTA